MSLFKRFRSNEYEPRRRRFTNGDFADLEDISDPHKREDETSTSVRQWIKENKAFVFLGLPTGAALTLLVLFYLSRIAPELAQNRIIQGGIGVGVYSTAIIWFAVSKYRENRDAHDKLELQLKDGGMELRGWYVEATDESGADMFVAAKGVRWTGKLGEPLRMGDFGHAVAENWAKANMDLDHPATIRLTGTHEIVQTEFGTTIIERGVELKVDEFARASAMRVVPPKEGDEFDLLTIREQLEAAEEELSSKKRELSAKRRHSENMQEIAEQNRDELMDGMLKFYTTIQAVNGRQSKQLPALNFDGNGDPMVDDWMDDVDQEVALDDD